MANMSFTNNATSALASGITASATSLTVVTSTGSVFPTLSGSQYFYCTLETTDGINREIVKVTARSGDTFTIVRGQDGTTGRAFITGDRVELRIVAASLNDFAKLSEDNTFSGLLSDSAGNVRSTPINSQSSAYVVAASDNGKVISITTGGVTINNSIMSAGMIVSIYNNSGSSQTITQGSGVTLQWAGQSVSTTGNRSLGLYGMCTIVFLSASSAVITGSGLS